jgi:hypothetical protein
MCHSVIHCICPDPHSNYTGHHDVDEESNEYDEEDEKKESFEPVLPDANFDGGEKPRCLFCLEMKYLIL